MNEAIETLLVELQDLARELEQCRDAELGQDLASKLPHIGTDLWAQYVLLEERNNKQ